MARKHCRTDSTNVHESPNGSSSDMISHNQQGVLWEYECRPEWRAFDSQTAKHESSQFRAPSRATNLASDWLRRKCKAQAIGPQASGVLAIIIHPSFLLPVTTVTAARAKQRPLSLMPNRNHHIRVASLPKIPYGLVVALYTYTIDSDLTRMMCMRRAFRSRLPRPEPWALLQQKTRKR